MYCGFGTLSSKLSSTVRNLGVTFDSHLRFDKQINNVVRTSFFQLRLLAKVKMFLSRHDLEKATHALIHSRLDYCNALYASVSQSSLSRLQLVRNAAAHLLTNTNRRVHITPVLNSLQWLPLLYRNDFKLLMFVFKALNGLAPSYLGLGLGLWNKLPAEMRLISDLGLFKSRLKTYLFRMAFNTQ
ncbi:hypothetical protein N1851_016060 [Merluccius polli]|uniref:Uncharacterized protein n=1 Tax=Merluccius polli TaxID=89951 RepID=A0AA47MR16_MERPO|nr:hypothetical protein N1851_016060 [Merluccius polli]